METPNKNSQLPAGFPLVTGYLEWRVPLGEWTCLGIAEAGERAM